MSVRNWHMIVAVVCAFIFVCILTNQYWKDHEVAPTRAGLLKESESVLVDPLTQFSAELFQKIKQINENVVISPISVHIALSLLLLGATPNSETEAELCDVLGYRNDAASIEKSHESYAKILAIINEINAIGQNKSLDEIGASKQVVPIVEFFNTGLYRDWAGERGNYSKAAKRYYNNTLLKSHHIWYPEHHRPLVENINSWTKKAGAENQFIDFMVLPYNHDITLLSASRLQAHWFKSFLPTNLLLGTEHNELHKRELIKLREEYAFYIEKLDRYNIMQNGLMTNNAPVKLYTFSLGEKTEKHCVDAQIKDKFANLYNELADMEFRLIEIPLIGNLTFTILKPLKNETGQELAKLEERLLATKRYRQLPKLSLLLNITDQSDCVRMVDILQIPKFKFESDVELIDPLRSLGLKRVFDKDRVELAKMIIQKRPIRYAKHKAVIDVNPSGINAPPTALKRNHSDREFSREHMINPDLESSWLGRVHNIDHVPNDLGVAHQFLELQVDKPFMFIIRYSRVPLFVGHYVSQQ